MRVMNPHKLNTSRKQEWAKRGMGGTHSTMANTPPQAAATNGTRGNQTITAPWPPPIGSKGRCIIMWLGLASAFVIEATWIILIVVKNWKRLRVTNPFRLSKRPSFLVWSEYKRLGLEALFAFVQQTVVTVICLTVVLIGKASGLTKLFALIILWSTQYYLGHAIRKRAIRFEVLTLTIMSGVIIPVGSVTDDGFIAALLATTGNILEILHVQFFEDCVAANVDVLSLDKYTLEWISVVLKECKLGPKVVIFLVRCILDFLFSYGFACAWAKVERPELWPDEHITKFIVIGFLVAAFLWFVEDARDTIWLKPLCEVVMATLGLLFIEAWTEPVGKAIIHQAEMVKEFKTWIGDIPQMIFIPLHAAAVTLGTSWRYIKLYPPAFASPEQSQPFELYEVSVPTQHRAPSDIAQMEV